MRQHTVHRFGVLSIVSMLAALALAPNLTQAAGGPFGIDHEWALDEHGIWSRGAQSGLEYGALAAEGLGALWFGNDDPLGHTFWQAIDSTAMSSIVAQGMKFAFSRARPSQGNNPNKWFQGGCCESCLLYTSTLPTNREV